MILFPFSLIVPLIPQQHTQERLKETREKKQLQSINAFWQPQAWTINPHGRKLWKMREKEFCLIYWASLHRWNEHCLDSILGQQLSLCRKFSALNRSNISSTQKKGVQSPKVANRETLFPASPNDLQMRPRSAAGATDRLSEGGCARRGRL